MNNMLNFQGYWFDSNSEQSPWASPPVPPVPAGVKLDGRLLQADRHAVRGRFEDDDVERRDDPTQFHLRLRGYHPGRLDLAGNAYDSRSSRNHPLKF